MYTEFQNENEANKVCAFINALFAKRGHLGTVVEVARLGDLDVWFVDEIQQEFPK